MIPSIRPLLLRWQETRQVSRCQSDLSRLSVCHGEPSWKYIYPAFPAEKRLVICVEPPTILDDEDLDLLVGGKDVMKQSSFERYG